MTVEKTPHYKVLFGGPGPTSLMVAYLPQTQLERVTGMKVSARTRTMWRLALESPPMLTAGRFQPDIPTLENYFTHYDGTRFVMQPWLRALFPEDESEDWRLAESTATSAETFLADVLPLGLKS